MKDIRKTYQAPRLFVHGCVEDVTRATNKGTSIDRQFVCASISVGPIGPPCTS